MKNISIDKISNTIAEQLSNRDNTFYYNNDLIECELGGTFNPSCSEMYTVSSTFFERANSIPGEINSIRYLKKGESFHYNNSPTRLYYEVLRKNTFFQFFKLRIQAKGILEVSIIAQNDNQEKIIQVQIIQFSDPKKLHTLASIDVASLPMNSSLTVKCKCLSEEGYIYGFRWLGDIPKSLANTGERIIMIRTFGCKSSVAANLKSIIDILYHDYPNILKRTLFIIYDATPDTDSFKISTLVNNIRIIELKGPNFGGGGNASILVSLIIRAGLISKYISEVILIDDDAKIDAETLIRHDAFITGRKQNIASTAVIYSSGSPSVIQEYGGFWGKFFSEKNHSVEFPDKLKSRLFFPYLVRNSRNILKEYDARYIAQYQQIEFSTFIFISFPYPLLEKIGAPLPFFLRNDDVEICLRIMKHHGIITVNPNLYAWHDSAHTPVGEFYSILHSLIINSSYGGISKEYFYITFMERLAKIAKVGNIILLYAYMQALEKFSQGSDWMQPTTIYSEYNSCRTNIISLYSLGVTQVPFEVVDKTRENIQIYSLVDIFPKNPDKNSIAFLDTNTNLYYQLIINTSQISITSILEKSIHYINVIAMNFDQIINNWKKFVESFDHFLFWNAVFIDKSIEVLSLDIYRNKERGNKEKIYIINSNKKIHKDNFNKNKNVLPPGFSIEGYLSHNPDVATSGIDPLLHWFQYGQYENRTFF